VQQQSGQLERPHLLRAARRNIARIETVLSRKAAQPKAK
jgi:ribosomal protein L29